MRLSYLGVLLIAAALVVAGCTESAKPPSTESPVVGSASYLATEPESGWIRSVSRDDGFVFVFESQREFPASGEWKWRFVLFNETGASVTLDGFDFMVQLTAEGEELPGMMIGGPRSGSSAAPVVEPPPVTLRSGESTTQEFSMLLDEPANTYEVVSSVWAAGLDSQTPTVTVISR